MSDIPDTPANRIFPLIVRLLPFPALTTLVIDLCLYHLSPQLTNIMCSINSVPALTSIVVEHPHWIISPPFGGSWVDVDRWLSRIAKHAEATRSFPLTLRRWPEGKSVWEGFLPEFRESGGKIKVDSSGS